VIKSIKAENYKSIKSLELELGRVNVFIGENGAGKSNILEVFALAGAAVARKLDNEFLASRGIRVVKPEHMQSTFSVAESSCAISIFVEAGNGEAFFIKLNNDRFPYSEWTSVISEKWDYESIDGIVDEVGNNLSLIMSQLKPIRNQFSGARTNKAKLDEVSEKVKLQKEKLDELNDILDVASKLAKNNKISYQSGSLAKSDEELFVRFVEQTGKSDGIVGLYKDIGRLVIYSPENSALRMFEREGQIEPLGINGEGLLKLLSVLDKHEPKTLQEIKFSLQVLGWFEDFHLVDSDTFSPSRIAIKDRYIEDPKRYFDQMSANEGFLFLLFYFALFSTKLTPSIFAIDNIDASLNPALCERLVRELVKLAKKHDKQVLLTTHNPATLDGLNLHDDELRLFVVSRGQAGETRVRRIEMKPQPAGKERPIRLSEMFLRGSLGGIPAGF
jgi:predicted ATPase